MIFDRIMLPAQGRNEDYKFAQTGSVRFVAGVRGAEGAEPTPSWLESAIKLDPNSGFLSVDDWHVKGDLVIEGQVNQWLAQQLVVDDARIQVNRKQEGAVVDSGLVIFDKDNSSEVSSLVYDITGVWKAGGEAIATKPWVENSATAYNAARLGGYGASNYPRKAENAVITGWWNFQSASPRLYIEDTTQQKKIGFANSGSALLLSRYAFGTGTWQANLMRIDIDAPNNSFRIESNGNVGLGIAATERLHVAGNGLFTGNLSAPTFVSGFAGSGWRLEAGEENHLTIDRLTVRGRMDVYELAINQIRGTNGAQWVSDSAKVESVSGNRLFIDTGGDTSFVPFVVNDLLRCQRWNGKNIKYYVVRVTAVGSNYIDVVLVDGSSPREAGDYLVRMGNTEDTDRQGALYLTSSDSNAPYMDVLDGVNSASFAGKTKVRIGRLDGITDPDLGTLSGYGLYTENGYFKGKIQVTGGNAATKADVDAVQVGGRNLVRKSIIQGYNGAIIQEDGTFDGIPKFVNTVSAGGMFGYQYTTAIPLERPAGTWMTLSFKVFVRAFDAPANMEGYVRVTNDDATLSTYGFNSLIPDLRLPENQNRWIEIVHTFLLTKPIIEVFRIYFWRSGVLAGDLNFTAPKLELGNKATDWTPAPEDVPSALDYLATAIQDGTTEIEGGLINTNVLMVKDTNGEVSGGISGLVSDNIGFWTGGTYEDAINNNANVIFRKDGSAIFADGRINILADGDTTIGDVHVDAGGALVIKQGIANRVLITKEDITTLAAISSAIQNETVNNSKLNSYPLPGRHTVSQPNTITVNNNGTRLTVTGTFDVSVTTGPGQRNSQAMLYVSVYLRKVGDGPGTGVLLSSGSVGVNKFTGEAMGDSIEGRSLNKEIIVTAGQYHIVAESIYEIDGPGPNEESYYYAVLTINATSMHALFDGSYQRSEIGRNGIGIIGDGFNYSFFGKEDGVYKTVEKVSNATMYDKPGVLFAGSIAADGSLTAGYWGAKYRAGSYYEGDNIYRIHHNVGHVNYYVFLTPHNSDARMWVFDKKATYVRVRASLASLSFDFVIIGNNQ